jgi:hypothetical protein
MPRYEAPSISWTSREQDSAISLQDVHALHGSPEGKSEAQLRAFANKRASVVFPVPREPEKRYAEESFPERIAFFSVVTIASCPTTSANVRGR